MKKYSEDYEIVVTKDENGRERETAEYRGDYFDVTFTVGDIAKYKNLSILLLALTIVFHVGAGFIDNQGMYQFFVALPYVFAFFPLLYLALGIFHLPKEARKFRRDEIGLSFDRIKTMSRVLLIFLGVGILGEIVFLLFFAEKTYWPLEFFYLLLQALAFSTVILFIRLQKRIHIQKFSDISEQKP